MKINEFSIIKLDEKKNNIDLLKLNLNSIIKKKKL